MMVRGMADRGNGPEVMTMVSLGHLYLPGDPYPGEPVYDGITEGFAHVLEQQGATRVTGPLYVYGYDDTVPVNSHV